MRWLPLALCLALAACDSDPCGGGASCVTLPPDAGDAGQVPDVSAADVVDAPDVVAVVDVPAADVGELTPDVVAAADAVAVDAGDDVVDVPMVDAVVVADAGADAVADVARVDVVDVPPADVPRDAGPSDAGGVVYDLEVGRGALEVRAAMHRTNGADEERDCADVTAMSCSVAGGVLSFSVNACFGESFTGRFVLGDAGPSTLSIFGGGGGSFARVLRFATGSRVGGRRSFHVQFSAPPFQGEYGFRGIPGRTVDPALADLWLLGCASD